MTSHSSGAGRPLAGGGARPSRGRPGPCPPPSPGPRGDRPGRSHGMRVVLIAAATPHRFHVEAVRDPGSFEAIRRRFAEHGQEHVFRFWDRLDPGGRARLLAQAARIDLDALERRFATTRELARPGRRRLEPAEIVRLPAHGGSPELFRRATGIGRELLAAGRVAVMVVAGGQGTRLGFRGPKGTFPIGPVSDRSLFELQAQKIRAMIQRYGRPLAWYIMTSPATDEETRKFFETHQYFELSPNDLFFFEQQTVPAVDFEGHLILEAPDRIFESPNGHGGAITALVESGAAADMRSRGVDTLFYYQVDNPLVRIEDPAYLGLHAETSAEMSCKVVPKRDPDEKMGVVALVDGCPGIVEYTELEDGYRHARDPSGELVFWAGNIAVHVFDLAFVERVAERADELLPYHASPKKIPHVDPEGRRVEPEEPCGLKFERFVFDALPAARRARVVEADRGEEYAPVKNASGPDSPETARAALDRLYRRWLRDAGVGEPEPGLLVEIDHTFANGPEDLKRRGVRSIAEAGAGIRVGPGGRR